MLAITMNTLIENLIGIFEEQIELHGSLIAILNDEKASIIGSQLSGLNKANKEKEALILKMKRLEVKRSELVSSLTHSLNAGCDHPTLKELCRMTHEPYTSRLTSCRKKLKLLIRKIKELNEGNKKLLLSSIEFVRGSLTLFNHLLTSRTNSVYYSSGKIENRNQGGRVLSGDI
jgi:flagellar biosynthesis/type III secretory pathway chaperone